MDGLEVWSRDDLITRVAACISSVGKGARVKSHDQALANTFSTLTMAGVSWWRMATQIEVNMALPAVYDNQITCSRCGRILGRVIEVEGEDLIRIGGLVVSEIDGNCIHCGMAFHYSLNQSRLERLIKRTSYKKKRKTDAFSKKKYSTGGFPELPEPPPPDKSV